MYQIPCTKYWNTWDSKSPATMEFLPAGVSIRIGAVSYAAGTYCNFPFANTIKLFEHHPDGKYCRLHAEHGGTVLSIEYAKPDDYTVLCRIRSIKSGEWGLRFQVALAMGFDCGQAAQPLARQSDTQAFSPAGSGCYIERNKDAFRAAYRSYQFAAAFLDRPIKDCLMDGPDDLGKALETLGYYAPMPRPGASRGAVSSPCERAAGDCGAASFVPEYGGALWYGSQYNLEETPEIVFAVSCASSYNLAYSKARMALNEDLDALKAACLPAVPKLSGENAFAIEAMRDVMAWNTIADRKNGRVFTSITRYWIDRKFGGWFVWLNDILMHGLINAYLGDLTAARACIMAAADNMTPEGNLACLMSEFTEWVDRSQPPIAGIILYKYYLITGDIALLGELYPVFKRAHEWWFKHRDGNKNGVLEYGSSQTGCGHFVGTKLAAKDESSMDNSPMHDSARYIPETNTLNMEDIALNSMLSLEGECLGEIALIIGDAINAGALQKRSVALKKKIDATLWDDENALYANKHWEKGFAPPSPTSFYPLAAGIPSAERAQKLIAHIFDESEFWTQFPLPSVWLKSEAVNDNVYWRGRAWPPLNFFTYMGLKRYGKWEEARKLLDKIMAHFARGWLNERACYENHNTFTGRGDDSVDTDPFYGWGALYPLMWIMEHIDRDPWHGINFGSVSGGAFEIENFSLGEQRYSLKCDENGTILAINGEKILETEAVGRFTGFEFGLHYACVTVPPQKSAVSFAFVREETPMRVLIDGCEAELANTHTINGGKIEIYW